MQTALSWFLFATGLFYTLGGAVLIRRMAMDTLLDDAIARLTLKRDRTEEAATRILTIGAWLTLASGLALMAQSRIALAVFVMNIILQTGYLIWAARERPPEGDLEERGRRATLNALFIYIGVFGLLMVAERQGLWRSWLGEGIAGLGAELVVIGLITAALAWLIAHPPGRRAKDNRGDDAELEMPRHYPDFLTDDEDGALPAYDPSRPPACLRLSPEYNCWPTWDNETYTSVDPATLGFSDSLLERILAWDELFQLGYNDEDPFNSRFRTLEEERLWTDQAEEIWQAILEEWPGQAVNNISLVPYLVAAAHEGLGFYETPPEDRLQQMAKECRLFEIRDILARLDQLATERAATPGWDGDTQDDIALTQKFYAMILTRTPPPYRDEVARGLASEEEETRGWVKLALDGAAG